MGLDTQRGRHHRLAADPLLVQHARVKQGPPSPFPSSPHGCWTQERLRNSLPVTAFANAMKWKPTGSDRRRGFAMWRRCAAPDLWYFSNFGLVSDWHSPSFPRLLVSPAGAVQGYFGGLDRSPVPALHRDLDLDSIALSAADHLFRFWCGDFFVLLGILLLFSWGPRSLAWCARRNSCAGRNFEYIQAGRVLLVCRIRSSSSAICCRTRWWRP